MPFIGTQLALLNLLVQLGLSSPSIALQVAAFQCLQPFIGTLLAFLVLNESPTAWDLGAVRSACVVAWLSLAGWLRMLGDGYRGCTWGVCRPLPKSACIRVPPRFNVFHVPLRAPTRRWASWRGCCW